MWPFQKMSWKAFASYAEFMCEVNNSNVRRIADLEQEVNELREKLGLEKRKFPSTAPPVQLTEDQKEALNEYLNRRNNYV